MMKWLLTIVIVVIVLGLVMPRLRQRVGSGRLPGDVEVRWRGRDYFFPFATTIVLSLLFVAVSRFL
ncbi:MAG: DUF2905 domain-containing protein [Betaproteobacteria bacterium]|jgi:hypothetical protein|uniref:DUF2905 domain-containing protein n=1 Tax=Candidatus Proximibacter danicus TaxID=2954365 RepID=A0A9D7K6G0_9PROT|nr:DUF2905 domain-containing protein [Candidatus Proximibacter danicus]MBK9447152.1 DUF2905 domain-containing protein [Betaproteobacteria bacterium]